MRSTIEWLLDPSQPAARFLALRDVVEGTSQGDLKEARGAISQRGWAAELLAKQRPDGRWLDKEQDLYMPKYLSTNWALLALSDLGVTREEPRIARSCELWMDQYAREDGGFDTPEAKRSEHCVVGNTARGLIKFGYDGEPRVRRALDLLVGTQKDDGGWHCFPSKRGTIDAWEGLSAFAAYPRQKWSRGMKAAVERGCEFFLERRLFRQGARYEPWFRLHFPYHYYYDILVGLDFVTALGYADDKRIGPAVRLLKKKRRVDGRWILDAAHPDLDDRGRFPSWWEGKKNRFHPLALERAGAPSKMVTLRALTVLRRVGELGPS
ncbi:MAG: hypothetical protein JRM73_00950 [Nitrososphaerota archaeon]|nr:hypothetical protein [Nitrososphaerota archaeon]